MQYFNKNLLFRKGRVWTLNTINFELYIQISRGQVKNYVLSVIMNYWNYKSFAFLVSDRGLRYSFVNILAVITAFLKNNIEVILHTITNIYCPLCSWHYEPEVE